MAHGNLNIATFAQTVSKTQFSRRCNKRIKGHFVLSNFQIPSIREKVKQKSRKSNTIEGKLAGLTIKIKMQNVMYFQFGQNMTIRIK